MIRRLRKRRSQAGSSMVEMITTLGLLGLVMVTIFAAVSSTTSVLGATEQRFTDMGEARTLMAVTTKDIRTAVRLKAGTAAFTLADKREITFYANLNNVASPPKQMHIYITTDNILISETKDADLPWTPPDYTYTGAATARYVGRYVANPTSQPLFNYYDVDGNQLTAPLSASDLKIVYSVQITLVVRKQTTLAVRSVTLVNQVRLPNVDYQVTTG